MSVVLTTTLPTRTAPCNPREVSCEHNLDRRWPGLIAPRDEPTGPMKPVRDAAQIARKRGERMLICLSQLASEMTARGAWGPDPRLRSGPRRREGREIFISGYRRFF